MKRVFLVIWSFVPLAFLGIVLIYTVVYQYDVFGVRNQEMDEYYLPVKVLFYTCLFGVFLVIVSPIIWLSLYMKSIFNSRKIYVYIFWGSYIVFVALLLYDLRTNIIGEMLFP